MGGRAAAFHDDGDGPDVEGAGGEEAVGNVLVGLGVHVVDVGLDDGGGVGEVGLGGLAEGDAEDVGDGKAGGSGAVAGLKHAHGGQGAVGVGGVGEDGGAGGGEELELDVGPVGDGAAAGKQTRSGGGGDGEAAVGGFDPAAAGVDGGYDDAVDAQQVEADDGADDIEDGVGGADFVELDLVDGGAVDVGFGFGEAAEDLAGFLFDPGLQVGGGDAGVDVGVGVVVVAAAGLDVEVDEAGLDEAALDAFVAEFPGGRSSLRSSARRLGLVEAGVEQGAEDHVAAGAGLAVEVGGGHAEARRAMRVAWTPAPKPLSMLTTETPGAQLVSMPRRAARPPKAAP